MLTIRDIMINDLPSGIRESHSGQVYAFYMIIVRGNYDPCKIKSPMIKNRGKLFCGNIIKGMTVQREMRPVTGSFTGNRAIFLQFS